MSMKTIDELVRSSLLSAILLGGANCATTCSLAEQNWHPYKDGTSRNICNYRNGKMEYDGMEIRTGEGHKFVFVKMIDGQFYAALVWGEDMHDANGNGQLDPDDVNLIYDELGLGNKRDLIDLYKKQGKKALPHYQK